MSDRAGTTKKGPQPVRRALPLIADECGDDGAATGAETEDLATQLAGRTIAAVLAEAGPPGYIRCTACAHRCLVDEGRAGACGVRFQRDGVLRVPFGYVARRYVRSVEINTVFHVRPGAKSLTFGMFGCDLRCPYCHNWKVSQALRQDSAGETPVDVSADELVAQALDAGCEVLCAAYNEPMIAAEWVHAVFTRARAAGLATALISDGNTTPEALAFMRPVTDVYRVDLKGYSADQYRSLGGRLDPVLAAIAEAKRQGYWVEVVTLVVPRFNDDLDGLRGLASQIAAIDPEIPWHLNAFHPRYKLAAHGRTPAMSLVTAAGMAYARGLKFVYVSNLPDEVQALSHTRCPDCQTALIERVDYTTRANHLRNGACPQCSRPIPGLWAGSS